MSEITKRKTNSRGGPWSQDEREKLWNLRRQNRQLRWPQFREVGAFFCRSIPVCREPLTNPVDSGIFHIEVPLPSRRSIR
ncbi:hypothetical protein ASPZODRAFT_129726 [Penicilliopsis zonata CBS 506.65]|uniref:Myb-like domain-containing protein n=1 Tax=Penicilliopsis zonata CBS 506.65 TaxID=1073090 RepID=A0A1L9SQ47_9EURO|nr:hypothetical protein ASPZODRAFT_129726 [Penicilliopsis zonata CBS 506.65]OJJ49288.1 hypothetical protein ASPZODRAFT_129726 [Penicilliopsis zonata CBS 506.65]